MSYEVLGWIFKCIPAILFDAVLGIFNLEKFCRICFVWRVKWIISLFEKKSYLKSFRFVFKRFDQTSKLWKNLNVFTYKNKNIQNLLLLIFVMRECHWHTRWRQKLLKFVVTFLRCSEISVMEIVLLLCWGSCCLL